MWTLFGASAILVDRSDNTHDAALTESGNTHEIYDIHAITHAVMYDKSTEYVENHGLSGMAEAGMLVISQR